MPHLVEVNDCGDARFNRLLKLKSNLCLPPQIDTEILSQQREITTIIGVCRGTSTSCLSIQVRQQIAMF